MVLLSQVDINAAARPHVSPRAVEICEHKGIGHHDTLTDGAREAAAVALARAYRAARGP